MNSAIYSRNADATPPAEHPRQGEEGISTPSRPPPECLHSGDIFEVDFDPKRNYLRELKNEKESQKGRRVQAFNADGDWILDDSRLRIVRIL